MAKVSRLTAFIALITSDIEIAETSRLSPVKDNLINNDSSKETPVYSTHTLGGKMLLKYQLALKNAKQLRFLAFSNAFNVGY